jgi:hypothetical protein
VGRSLVPASLKPSYAVATAAGCPDHESQALSKFCHTKGLSGTTHHTARARRVARPSLSSAPVAELWRASCYSRTVSFA